MSGYASHASPEPGQTLPVWLEWILRKGSYLLGGGRLCGLVFCPLMFLTVTCKVRLGGSGVFLEGSVRMDVTRPGASPSTQDAGESRLEMQMEIPRNWCTLWACGNLWFWK